VNRDRPFGRWGGRVYEGLGHLGGLILAVMTLAVFLQVVLRYVFAYAVEGMDELPRYLFVWLVMIGAAAAMHRGQHTTLEFFRDRLGRRGGALARVLTGLGGMGLFLSLIRSSVVLVPNSQLQSSPGLGLPLGYVYLAVPVGAILILLPMAWHVVHALRELWQRRS